MNDKKNIWILNHYATGMFINCTGRHYALKKYLGEMGYNVTAFASNVYKDGSEEIEIENFYEEKGLENKPVRCKECRIAKKEAMKSKENK